MLTQKLDASSADDLQRAESILREGGLLAVPTETVYGLAADASNAEAVNAIFAAKGRPADHPLIVHIASFEEVENWATDIPPEAQALAAAFWPGPLTILLKKANRVPTVVTGGLSTIGLRVPSHTVLHRLLVKTGLGLAAPSANPYKQLSPTSASQVLEKLDGKIDGVLEGGDCQLGVESTILDLSGKVPQILRVGPILPSEISHVLSRPVAAPLHHSVSVSGNVEDHYQPRTSLRLVNRDVMREKLQNPSENEAYIVAANFPQVSKLAHHNVVAMPADSKRFAQSLYRTLNEIDQLGLDVIWFEQPLETEEWLAVNDRLKKACHND
ncbi:MAG: L-threonylcarbamoyladenylate synthase [Pseudohongiellaceae bacterium]